MACLLGLLALCVRVPVADAARTAPTAHRSPAHAVLVSAAAPGVAPYHPRPDLHAVPLGAVGAVAVAVAAARAATDVRLRFHAAVPTLARGPPDDSA